MAEDSQTLLLILAAFSPVVFAVVYALIAGRRRGERLEANLPPLVSPMEALAERLGARVLESGVLSGRCEGEAHGRPYRLRLSADGNSEGLLLEVDCRLPEGVGIDAEPFFSREDPEIGSEAFDSVVRLSGDTAWLSAALTPEARRALLSLQSLGRYRFTGDTLQVGVNPGGGGDDAVVAVDAATRLAAWLDFPLEEVPARLLEAAALPERCGSLAALPERSATLAALRLLAQRPDSPEAVALSADPPPTAQPFADLVLDRPGAEAALQRALSAPDAQVRLAAAELLSRKGTVASVQPLRDAATGLVRGASQQAVRAIQDRAGPANAGGLAVVAEEPAGGELTLADAERGRVSLAKQKS